MLKIVLQPSADVESHVIATLPAAAALCISIPEAKTVLFRRLLRLRRLRLLQSWRSRLLR